MKVLIKQKHGLGDAIQLSVILKHLKHYHPDWLVDVELSKGKHSASIGFCNNVWISNEKPAQGNYDEVYNLSWFEPNRGYGHVPSGKPARCLYEVFHLEPVAELFYYELTVDDASRRAAKTYLNDIAKKKGYVFIHYQGNSSVQAKNLSHEDVRTLCEYLLESGYTPIIFDFDRRSPLPDQHTIFCPDKDSILWDNGVGDSRVIAALIEQAALFVGIDSGPLHIAGATSTPSIGVWTRHHPVNFFELSKNVVHLLPQDAKRYIRGREKDAELRYFESNYRYQYYESLGYKLRCEAAKALHLPQPTGNPNKNSNLLRSFHYGEGYYQEHKDAGIDYAHYGDWQREYCHWISDCFKWRGRRVLDVGCACGALAQGMREKQVECFGCDVNEHCIRIGRERWPELPLVICDAVNLHPFPDHHFDGIHMMQVAEHIKPALVPFMMGELNRVSKPGAFFFTVHDTLELFERTNRTGVDDDPTHVCIKTRDWWRKIMEMTGWEDCSNGCENELRAHGLSYLKKYDWDWFVFRKIRDFTTK